MGYVYEESPTGGRLVLTVDEGTRVQSYERGRKDRLLAIAWNRGAAQTIWVDGGPLLLQAGSVVTLTSNQTYHFERPEQVVQWQFNREFYCVVDHDVEVSCAGLLFFGSQGIVTLEPDEGERKKLQALLDVFVDEMQTRDATQGEMLRMLLKRLIIRLTRLARDKYLSGSLNEELFDVVRQFNVLVENHYKTHHQVKDYARMLNKSPKTLANRFAQYHDSSPLQVIRGRIVMEGKRLLRYTDKSVKEITYELGFDEASHFSRFFKKETGVSPIAFRAELNHAIGQI